jgi:transcriptional regulator with GAF, ATPase, and Fis domain
VHEKAVHQFGLTMTGDSQAESVAEHLAAIARDLHTEDSTQATLNAICGLSVDFVSGAEHAGITVVRGREFATVASTGEAPAEVDKIQYRTAEGPCVDAIRDHETFLTADLRTESGRWPAFAPAAVDETKVLSILSYRLFLEEDTLGALNLYSSQVDAFSEDAVKAGSVLAVHAALAYGEAKLQEKADNLEVALHTSRRIGMAIGVLMAMHKIAEQQAFDELRLASQQTHRKLRDVSEDVIATGAIPAN